jgi:hypothetical protein
MPYIRIGMPRAITILREKVIDEDGNLLEMAISRVPGTATRPRGVRYRPAFVPPAADAPAVLNGNHAPKGHHRHVGGSEERYIFVGVEQLLADFMADVRRVTGDKAWPGR